MKTLRWSSWATELLLVGSLASASAADDPSGQVYLVPNLHPASCGWLTDFSQERVYCANGYLDHLNRVASDPDYAFVISEVNNMIAIHNFTPNRFEELRRRISAGRVEAVNALFLEATINLSGGEALVKQGIEGIRWQRAILGVRPRHCWMIDVTGMHWQMAQIAAGLGLETMVHCRHNPSGSTLYWAQSPDGTRIPTLSPGPYSQWRPIFDSDGPLSDPALGELVAEARSRAIGGRHTPDGAPLLVLGGSGDYSQAPNYQNYPGELVEQWRQTAPDLPLRFSTLGPYVDTVLPDVQSGKIKLPTVRAGWGYSWLAFWIQCPRVKQRYRVGEHALQAAEMLSTAASLGSHTIYPTQDLYHAWLQMLLNMDRNTLWGAAGGMVFEHPSSWDASDRFNWVDAHAAAISRQAVQAMRGAGQAATLFNPANWQRGDPVTLSLGRGVGLKGVACQQLPDGQTLCCPEIPSVGLASFQAQTGVAAAARAIALPPTIETSFYMARVDPHTGALLSLRLKPSGREMLAGPANVLVAEVPTGPVSHGHDMLNRPQRKAVANSSEHGATTTVTTGPVATVVETRAKFYGGREARRVLTFHHNHPRIDFDTYLEDIPNHSVVVTEFPLAGQVREVRRGIPYGFAHGAWPEATADLPGAVTGIAPAVRWSAYTRQEGGGVALLDRGLTGREINGNTPVLFLLSTADTYMGHPSPWLSGKGKHHLQYALVAYDGPWAGAGVARLAWEYNAPPVLVRTATGDVADTFVETSDNIIVQALRREGTDIELRLVECLGSTGQARVTVRLPHRSAALTNLLGEDPQPLTGGPTYRFAVRPQQIVTLRLRTAEPVATVAPLTDWSPLVPEHKRPALRRYDAALKGHP